MHKDNHYGSDFAGIKAKYPKAKRYHWAEDAFNPSKSTWMLGYTIEYGAGVYWAYPGEELAEKFEGRIK